MTLSEFIADCMEKRKLDSPHFLLACHIRDAGLPEPECEVELVEGRKFKSDFHWANLFCVEIDGLYSSGNRGQTGGHLQPVGYTKDCFKQLEIVVQHKIPTHHFVPEAIYSGYALWWLTLILTGKDIGRPAYNPGIKVKKNVKKKETVARPNRRANKQSQTISVV